MSLRRQYPRKPLLPRGAAGVPEGGERPREPGVDLGVERILAVREEEVVPRARPVLALREDAGEVDVERGVVGVPGDPLAEHLLGELVRAGLERGERVAIGEDGTLAPTRSNAFAYSTRAAVQRPRDRIISPRRTKPRARSSGISAHSDGVRFGSSRKRSRFSS
jgi:hypothetical protein